MQPKQRKQTEIVNYQVAATHTSTTTTIRHLSKRNSLFINLCVRTAPYTQSISLRCICYRRQIK